MGMFERLLGPSSSECPKALLVGQWVAFPNFQLGRRVDFFRGHCSNCLFMELSLSSPCHSFQVFVGFLFIFVGVINASNSRPLPFQAHLKLVRKLFPPRAITCVPPFEQLIEKGANCLQKNISEGLHDHSFTSILSNLPSDSHQICQRSCAWLNVGTWLLIHPIIPFFHLLSHVFSIALRTGLGHSHPLVLWVPHYICNQPDNSCGLGKGWSLLQSIPDGHVSPCNYKGF